MANPPCMSDDGNQAAFLGTYLETGATVALCDECMVAWAAATLNAMTGVDPTPFLQAISEGAPEAPEESDTPASPATSAAGEASDPPPPTAKRGRTSTASRAAGMEDGPPADPPADDLTEPAAAA